MRFSFKMAVTLGFLLSSGLFSANADNVQSALDGQARNIQNEMNRGQISQGQAMQMENQVYHTAQQSQMDRAMNGGHINGYQRQQLGAQMQGISNMNHGTMMNNSGMGNGYNNNAYGYNNGGFSHHHNWSQTQNQGYGAPPPWTQGNQNNYQQMGHNWQNQQYAQGQQQSGVGGMLHRYF
jgi:hypothetical protein